MGFRCQAGSRFFTPYMKLRQNGIVSLMFRPAVFFSGGRAYMKLHMRFRLSGTVNPQGGLKALNVEHRTPNIERRILMALGFIDFITSEPQPALSIAESKFEV